MSKIALRGLAHLLVGGICAAFIWFLPHWAAVAFLATASAFFLLADILRLYVFSAYGHLAFLYRPFLRENEQGRLSGATYFAAGCLITALVFAKPLAGVAVLFLTFGDLAATLVGSWRGRIIHWGKSLEGSLACLAVCSLIALIVSFNQTDIAYPALWLGALTATLLEALPLKINDNLSLPIGSAAVMLAVGKLLS